MKKFFSYFEKKSLTTKLLIGFSMGIAIAVILSINSILAMREITEATTVLYDKEMLGISHLKEANINLIYIGRALRHMMIASNAADRAKAKERLDRAVMTLQHELEEGKKRIFREENIRNVNEFESIYGQYIRNVNHVMELMEREGYHKASPAVEFIMSPDFIKVGDSADNIITKITLIKTKGAAESASMVALRAETAVRLSVILMLISVVFAVIAGIVIGRSIKHPNDRLRTSIESLSAGKLDSVVPHTDYPNETGIMARSIKVLQEVYISMEAQRWVKTNIAEMTAKLQQAASIPELAQSAMSSLCPLINALHGAFYVHADDTLVMRGRYGYTERKHLSTEFRIGQGLVGQCAMDRLPITITKPPEDYIQIRSGMGECTPKVIAVVPVLQAGAVLGVIEVAALEFFGERETALLDSLVPVIGVCMELLERSTKTQLLLEETQAQATRMEAQAAQLEEQSVEMAAQQAELMSTEQWYRSIIESVPDGALVVDSHGTIILSNQRAEFLFGYEPGQMNGLPLDSLVPQSVRGHHPELCRSFIRTGESRPMDRRRDLQGVRHDGSEFPIEVGLSVLPDIGGRGVCAYASIRDITDRT